MSHLNQHFPLWFCQMGLSLYAFPPIPLFERTLMKIREDLVTFTLTAWKLSGVPSKIKSFQSQLSRRSLLPLETHLKQCTKVGGNVLLAGLAKWVKNTICTSLKHILAFLQAKPERLSVNTIKGYVTAISRRHAMVYGTLISTPKSSRGGYCDSHGVSL